MATKIICILTSVVEQSFSIDDKTKLRCETTQADGRGQTKGGYSVKITLYLLTPFRNTMYLILCASLYSLSIEVCYNYLYLVRFMASCTMLKGKLIYIFLSSYGGLAILSCNLNSLSLIIFIISDAKASGSPMQSALRDGCAGSAISAPF